MEQINVNYGIKSNSAWLRYCAEIVKPCAKELHEVMDYLAENYDTEPMNEIELEKVKERFAQNVESDRYSDLSDKNVNRLSLNARDDVFTILSLYDSRMALESGEPVDRAGLSLKGYKILKTERNKERIFAFRTHPHLRIEELYKNDEYGYIFWDDSLQSFCADGYGSLEIMDDLRIYRGVTQEDIDNLTERFRRFTQLFPHSGYTLSGSEFVHDEDMRRKYHFRNHRSLFIDMLSDHDVRRKSFEKRMSDIFKKQWYESLVPMSAREYAGEHYYFDKDGYSGYLWNVFEYGDVDCLRKRKAMDAFDAQQKEECIIFFSFENYSYRVTNAGNLSAECLNEFSEVFIADDRFTWTYIHTHEGDSYFYKKGAQYEKDEIRNIMKCPGMYVGANRMDYVRHFLGGLHFPICKPNFYESNWVISHDLEKWLFINESVSIRHAASINGWDVFFRTFGIYDLAVRAFNDFLCDDSMLTEYHVDSDRNLLKETPAWGICETCSEMSGKQRNKGAKFDALINTVNEMIGERTENIKIYLYCEAYFLHIRFYFKRDNCWVDSNTLKSHDGYYSQLIALHAQAEWIFSKAYLYKILTVNRDKDITDVSIRAKSALKYSWDKISQPDKYKEEDCFFNMLKKWRERMDFTL